MCRLFRQMQKSRSAIACILCDRTPQVRSRLRGRRVNLKMQSRSPSLVTSLDHETYVEPELYPHVPSTELRNFGVSRFRNNVLQFKY